MYVRTQVLITSQSSNTRNQKYLRVSTRWHHRILFMYYHILYAGNIFDHSITAINISDIIIICINIFASVHN